MSCVDVDELPEVVAEAGKQSDFLHSLWWGKIPDNCSLFFACLPRAN